MFAMFRPDVPVGASDVLIGVSVPSREEFLRLMGRYVLQSNSLPPRKTVGGKSYCSDPSGRDIVLTPEAIVRAACGDCKKLSMLEARWAIDEGAQTVELCMTDSDSSEEHVFVRVDGQLRDPALQAGMPPRAPDNYICVRIWPPENAPSLVRRAQGGVSESFPHGPAHRRAAGPGVQPMANMNSQAHNVFVLDRNGIPQHKDRVMTRNTKRAQGSGGVPGTVGTLDSGSYLYAAPDGSGNTLGDFPKGMQVQFIQDGHQTVSYGPFQTPSVHQWVQVKIGNITGYLWDEIVTWGAPPAQAPSAPAKQQRRPGSIVTVGGAQYRVGADGYQLIPVVSGSGSSSNVVVSHQKSVTRVQTYPDGSQRTFYSDGSSAVTRHKDAKSSGSVVVGKSQLTPWVSTTNGGQMIWSGSAWVPNPSYVQQGGPPPVYMAGNQGPGWTPPNYPTMPVQPVYVTQPPPVQLVPSPGVSCEVQIVDQQAWRVCAGQPPMLLGQYIGNNQVVLNGSVYNVDPATGQIQFAGPYSGSAAMLPVAQVGAPDALAAVQNAAALLSGVSDVVSVLAGGVPTGSLPSSGLVFDQQTGLMWDPSTGLAQDPSTGQMVDPSLLLGGGGSGGGGSPDDGLDY